MKHKLSSAACLMASMALFSTTSFGQEEKKGWGDKAGPDYLTPFNVIGSKADVSNLKGSGTVLNSDDLDKFYSTDITEILRQVPGVYVRSEEGYGLFPNISLRGTDPNRSQKVTILEDGLPASPSPFSAPAAYYSPTAGRMAGFEILKGSSQLKYGPNNSGGVINYLSTPIPEDQMSYLRGSYGENNSKIAHAYSGGKLDFAGGKLGYLLEVFDQRTDGWKTIADDSTQSGGLFKGGNAPVYKNDMLLKLSYEFGEDNYLEFKVGRTDLDGDVSYIGLTKADFDANPYQRYAGTIHDNMDSDQTRYYLRYMKEINESTKLTASIFSNEFNRDWYKISKVDGNSIGTGALGTANNVAILKGDANGTIRYKHNDRSYETKGIQANLDFVVGNNNLDLGFRYTDDHYSYNPGYTEDDYTMSTTTGLGLASPSAPKTKGNKTNRDSKALEIYLIDEISFGALTVTPGIRYTDVDYDYNLGETSISDTLLGVAASYDLDSNLLFAGVHEGHSLPGPTSSLSEETSLGFEIGVRSKGDSSIFYEVAYFNTQFDDMIVYPSVGAGSSTESNVGEASTSGVEVLIGTALDMQGFRVPMEAAFTFTNAEFDTTMSSSDDDAENRYDNATKGNKLPYIPDFQLNLRAGLEFDKLSTYLNYHWQDEVYVNGSNTVEITGFAAKLPDYGVLNWSAFYELTDNVTVFGKVSNLTDEKYSVSDLPDGYRPGAPRVASLGLEFNF
jgi:Fe(3+) dicitrate transport protein